MPKRLPVKDIVTGLLKNIFKAIKFWLHSTLVAISWMAIVPLTACRIYRCLFAGSVSSLLTLPLDMLSTDNIVSDILQGGFVVLCSLAAFISLVWLREQILSGGGPDWLEQNNNRPNPVNNPARIQRQQNPGFVAEGAINNIEPQEVAEQELVNNLDNLNQPLFNQVPEPPQQQQVNDARVAAAAAAAEAAAAANNDDNHWNPMEWDRAAEDLTWDRVNSLIFTFLNRFLF